MEAVAAVSGLEILGFCRSWADESSGGTCFVKIFSDLCRFERKTSRNVWEFVAARGGAWRLRC